MSKTIPNISLLSLPKQVHVIDHGEVFSLSNIPKPSEKEKNTAHVGYKRYKHHDIARVSTVTHSIDLTTKKGMRAQQIKKTTWESVLVPDHIKKEAGDR